MWNYSAQILKHFNGSYVSASGGSYSGHTVFHQTQETIQYKIYHYFINAWEKSYFKLWHNVLTAALHSPVVGNTSLLHFEISSIFSEKFGNYSCF